jgi:hypothetical protein
MNRIEGQLNAEERGLLIDLYIEGLDEGNDEKIGRVLQLSLRDSFLDEMIDRVNSEYVSESVLGALAEKVVELAHEHLPSAFEKNKPENKVLTFGDVAKQLVVKKRVPEGEEETNQYLAENDTPLPAYLSLAEIKRIAEELKLAIKDKYWIPFFREANFLIFRRSQQQAAYATRAKRLQKKREQSHESSEKTNDK